MRFLLGSSVFRVQVTDGYPLVDGEPCDGKIDFTAGLVQLADHLSPEDRAHTLWHELRHWWTRHHGQPVGVEADCDSTAAFGLEVSRQFEQQGGVAALASMMSPRQVAQAKVEASRPLARMADVHLSGDLTYDAVEIDEPPEHVADRLGGGPTADCHTCEATFHNGSVWTGRPTWCEQIDGRPVGGMVVERSLYCSHCGHAQRWTEGFDEMLGRPNGVPVSVPVLDATRQGHDAHYQRLAEMKRGGSDATHSHAVELQSVAEAR